MFLFAKPLLLAILLFYLIVVIKMAKMSLFYVFYRLRFLVWFFVFGAFFYTFFTPGRIFFSLPGFHLFLTWEGLHKGLVIFMQLSLMATASFIVFQTTSTVKLVKSLQSIFYPFFRLGVKVPDITLMLMITLQFIPILLAEGKKIIHIQMIRLGPPKGKGWIKYVKNVVPLVIPLFHMLIRRVHTLALAIELRGYTGETGRQQFYLPRIHKGDMIAFLVTGFYMCGLLIMGAGYF